MSTRSLREEVERRARMVVPFTDWDAFILGETQDLTPRMLPAGEVARREEQRWSRGRFPSIQLAIADALFSKTRKYEVVVRTCIRPFAKACGSMTIGEFVVMAWEDVFHRVFGRAPGNVPGKEPHHLSDESRIGSTLLGSRAIARAGISTPREFRSRIEVSGGESQVRSLLAAVPGMGPALQAYTLMNLGILTLKADRHVIRVAATHLDLSPGASPAEYESRLRALEPELGMSAFQLDQILWYTEAGAADVKNSKPIDSATTRSSSVQTTTPKPLTEASDCRTLVGSVVDIQPNKDRPTLELRFSRDDSDCLPSQNKAHIDLTIGDVRWQGTIGITANNPPYVHTKLRSKDAERSMTDILRALGCKERARLEFECTTRGSLRLLSVLDEGRWRAGSVTGVRAIW